MTSTEIDQLRAQLIVARNEISNLRSQINSLSHVHKKDVEAIRQQLSNLNCKEPQEPKEKEEKNEKLTEHSSLIKFKPIGYIKSIFNEKRAVPRQASVAETILSKLELNKDLFSNPEHSLVNLEEFSHIFILYHFHKNESHVKPKVYPPRLDGKNVGVFATRSPHRPNSIGMSLVKLDKIDMESATIYFYGTDMLDATPVIDIKPYIPHYDSPQKVLVSCNSNDGTPIKMREEPEGEEEHTENSGTSSAMPVDDVKVPDWVNNDSTLTVIFSENSLQQIKELGVNQKSIQEILQADPRSVYVRERYLSQIYSFQIDGKNVICRFDDKNRTVTVLQVKTLMDMSA